MRTKAPVSTTSSVMTPWKGAAESLARTGIAFEYPEAQRLARIVTQQEFQQQQWIEDAADVLFLLEWTQATVAHPISATQLRGMSESHRLRQFASKFWPLTNFESAKLAPLSPRAIESLLAQAKDYIRAFIIDHEPVRVSLKTIKEIRWLPPKASWSSPDTPPPGAWVYLATIAEDLPDAFALRVAELLEHHGARIGHCPECHRLFLRIKSPKQEYCSPSCSQKVRTARMRTKPSWPDKRHALYVEKVRKLKGPRAAKRVQRRPSKENASPPEG
jgi:hypothetical protein